MWMTFREDQSLRWRILLTLLVGAFLAGMVLSMVLAARRVTRVVDVDYYEHGLHYGRTASGSVNPGLAWNITAALAGSELKVTVADGAGAPVPGGRLTFQPEQRGTQLGPAVQLAEVSPGTFQCPRPLSAEGELHGTLRFSCGAASATRKLVFFN